MAGEVCSIIYQGKERKFLILNISGDFGDNGLTNHDFKKEETDDSNIHLKLENLLLEHHNRADSIVTSRSSHVDDRTPIHVSHKFVYYICQLETVMNFGQTDGSTEKRPTYTGGQDKKITYQSIGGFSAQMEAVKETIELPLMFPNLFRECGVYLSVYLFTCLHVKAIFYLLFIFFVSVQG